jgi:hypothetical protein
MLNVATGSWLIGCMYDDVVGWLVLRILPNIQLLVSR